jgi:hypothetical protein
LRSYLVLTPPGGPDPDHRSTLVMPDRFSWTGFFLTWIWLFWHRLWIVGGAVLIVQVGSGLLMQLPGFAFAGGLIGLGLSLLIGLEGRQYYCDALVRRGWKLETVIFAQDLQTAEEIYFLGLPQPERQPMPLSSSWAQQAKPPVAGQSGAALGLFDYGGR